MTDKKETTSTKVIWIVIGALIGSVVSLSFDKLIVPFFRPTPKIQITATGDYATNADFLIKNIGSDIAEDVEITIWASGVFSPRTDISNIQHAGGQTDASAEFGIYEARMTGDGKVLNPYHQNSLNTTARAVIVKFKRINPGEQWKGHVEFSGTQVQGLMATIKGNKISENQYAMFDKGL